MGDFQQLFQHLISDIKNLLTQAQSAGRVEKYQLEVIFSTSKPFSSQNDSHDEDLNETIYGLLQTVQKIVEGFYTPSVGSKDVACTDQRELRSPAVQSNESNMDHVIKLYSNENQNEGMFGLAHQVDSTSQNPSRLDCISHHSQGNHCLNQSEDCLSPQHPTTKETEAANVLMNLSGKATDRVTLGRLDSCLRPQELTSFDGKSAVFLLPAGSSSFKWDPSSKREHPMCDEVPQINEKDLLPLATQVLCQFCSRQCEDLVELHEHVLAMHNITDSELPLIPSVKKSKISGEEGEKDQAVEQLPDSEIHKENLGSHCLNPLNNVAPMKFCIEGQGLTNKQEISRKHFMEDKAVVMKTGMYGSTSHLNCYENSGERFDGFVNCLEGEGGNRDHSCEVIKTTQHGAGGNVFQSMEAEPCLMKQQQVQIVTMGKEYDQENHSEEGENLDSSCSRADITELTPVVSDALAIAVESSQIKDIEPQIKVIVAKVTIFVCLKCSSSYTQSQEYKAHVCSADRPFTQTCVDGSVALVNDSTDCEDHIQLHQSRDFYFPEFFIRQTLDSGKQNFQIIHCTSGRKLQLYTSYQPSYLSEQFILFRCPTCEKDLDSFSRFLDHLAAGPCMFRCPECNLVYVTQDKLQKHRAFLHPNLEDRTCPRCHMVFEKRHQRNKHLKTKCSQNHICVICGSTLKNEYNLRVHMQSHKERNHVCKECGASFYRRTILVRHMMRHSGTRPHECPLCNAKFFTRQHRDMHLDRHNGVKRHACTSCDKAYYSKGDRDNHYLKIHSRSSAGQKFTKVQEEKCINEPLVE